jgi:anti-anti-sigma factor
MELLTTRHADVMVIGVTGRIDHTNAEAFKSGIAGHVAACHAGGDRVLFDLSGLDYISSAGLRVLMLASKSTRPVGGQIAVAAPQSVVREILDITRFNLVFPVYDSVAAGLRALSQAAAAPPAESSP